jgi:chromosome segregation ATPase
MSYLKQRPGEDDPDPTDLYPGMAAARGAASMVPEELEGRDAAIAELTSRLREKSFALSRLERRLARLEQERVTLAAQHDERRAALAELQSTLAATEERATTLERERDEWRSRALERVKAGAQQQRYLVRLDGKSADVHAIAKPRLTVGRTPDNDVQIRESWMSRCHAILRLEAGVVTVDDAVSSNGVFVNNRRVRSAQLNDGDTVAFGKARFRYHVL